jgi:hypothetical protein
MMAVQGTLAVMLSLRASAADAPIVTAAIAASNTVESRFMSISNTAGAHWRRSLPEGEAKSPGRQYIRGRPGDLAPHLGAADLSRNSLVVLGQEGKKFISV